MMMKVVVVVYSLFVDFQKVVVSLHFFEMNYPYLSTNIVVVIVVIVVIVNIVVNVVVVVVVVDIVVVVIHTLTVNVVVAVAFYVMA